MLLSLAAAHPAGGALPGHRLTLVIGPEGLLLHQWTRMPVHHVLENLEPTADFGPAAADAFVDRKHQELADNLVIKVDGEVQRWAVVADTRSSKGDDVFLFFEQDLQVLLEPGDHEITLRNGNLPDMPAFFWVEGELSRDWVLEDSSLVVDGVPVSGDWSLDESLREVRLDISHAGPLQRAMRTQDRTVLAHAGPPKVPRDWWVLGGVCLLAGLGAGAFLSRRAVS